MSLDKRNPNEILGKNVPASFTAASYIVRNYERTGLIENNFPLYGTNQLTPRTNFLKEIFIKQL